MCFNCLLVQLASGDHFIFKGLVWGRIVSASWTKAGKSSHSRSPTATSSSRGPRWKGLSFVHRLTWWKHIFYSPSYYRIIKYGTKVKASVPPSPPGYSLCFLSMETVGELMGFETIIRRGNELLSLCPCWFQEHFIIFLRTIETGLSIFYSEFNWDFFLF